MLKCNLTEVKQTVAVQPEHECWQSAQRLAYPWQCCTKPSTQPASTTLPHPGLPHPQGSATLSSLGSGLGWKAAVLRQSLVWTTMYV